MGQTLTHGIYLPDEGERNCYDGLASNWQLLDGAVGTIAQHTTQIAGKASASHSHGNITNDGKLATASKALVTDSNKNITTSSVSDTELSYLSGVTSAIQTQLNAKAADSGVVHKTGNESIAGNKTWTADQTIKSSQPDLTLANSSLTQGTIPASQSETGVYFSDNSNNTLGRILYRQFTDGSSTFWLSNVNRYKNGALDTTGNTAWVNLSLDFTPSGEKVISANTGVFKPAVTSVTDLGTSTNKWKTLNGINPGALSLPNIRSGADIDITSWSERAPNGRIGGFIATVDCWVSVQMTRNVDWGIWVIAGNFRQSYRATNNNGTYLIMVTIPLAKGDGITLYTPEIQTTEAAITFGIYKYFPCLGNV